jgi:hypothetical protein
LCYYRPKNHFSRQIFGGFAKESEHKKDICAEDSFAYAIYRKNSFPESELPEGWEIRKYNSDDYWELDQFYKHRSGGMLLKVLQLSKCEDDNPPDLEETYRRSGLFRKTDIFSIYRGGSFVALLVADQSNLGFNLSNLLNSIKIIVLRPNKFPKSVFEKVIGQVIRSYETRETPVLVYPYDYFESMNPRDKARKYVMWCADARHVSEFMDYSKKKFKIFYW